MTDYKKPLARPLYDGEMPILVITCGDRKTLDPHGLLAVAQFFDSRFENIGTSGKSMPRTDMPKRTATEKFTWDCYRQDIGNSIVKQLLDGTGESLITTGYKSGDRLRDTAGFVALDCPGQIPSLGRNGELVQATCSERTLISREDWREVGKELMQAEYIKLGQQFAYIDRKFVLSLVNAIKRRRKAN